MAEFDLKDAKKALYGAAPLSDPDDITVKPGKVVLSKNIEVIKGLEPIGDLSEIIPFSGGGIPKDIFSGGGIPKDMVPQGDQGGKTPGSPGPGMPTPPSEQPTEVKILSKPIIYNVKKYDIRRLRSASNLNKYINEDPLAFIGNYVWSYDLDNPNNLVFRYQLPDDYLNVINKNTFNFIYASYNAIKKESAYKMADGPEKNLILNNRFKDWMTKAIVQYFKNTKHDDKALAPYFTSNDGNIFVINYERLFFFWINQIFSTNMKVSASSDQKKGVLSFALPPDKINAISLIFALYYLQDRLSLGGQDMNFVELFEKFTKEKKTALALAGEFHKLSVLMKNYIGKSVTNSNNYYSNEILSSIEVESKVNYQNSPFFNKSSNTEGISKSVSRLITAKELNKCKDTKATKQESSLRLFYKEGNDSILNGEIPEDGLGCATDLLSWKQAENILFNISSLQQPRTNLILPYYNSIDIKIGANIIPSTADVLKSSNKSQEQIKQFRTLLALTYLNATGDISAEKVLLDNSLVPSGEKFDLANLYDAASFFESVFFAMNPPGGIWGPTDFSNKILNFSTPAILKPTAIKPYAPYVGMSSIGYLLEKTDPNTGVVYQSQYVNETDSQQNAGAGYKDSFVILDSQIKYGKSYVYKLKQLVSSTEIQYSYGQIEFIFSPDSFSMVNIEFSLSELDYNNKLQEIEIAKQTSPTLAFIDIPPNPTWLEIYPYRGVNNKISLVFRDISFFDFVQQKIISKAFWSDGWASAKNYYMKNAKIDPNSISPETAFFTDQYVDKILIYRLEGKKPTKLTDFNEVHEVVNVLEDGRMKVLEIEPNVQYYFATKSVTLTGLESYLSQVYSVQVVDDGGTIFPLVEIIELEEPPPRRKKSKEFTSAFRIQPALLQQAPNPSTNDVGYLTPTVFSDSEETRTAYKVRVTSKKTGRKIDFNVIYKIDKKTNNNNVGQLNPKTATKKDVLMSYKYQEPPTEDKKALGEDCSVDSDCKSESCETGKCTSQYKSAGGPGAKKNDLNVGMPCVFTEDCKSGMICKSQRCQPAPTAANEPPAAGPGAKKGDVGIMPPNNKCVYNEDCNSKSCIGDIEARCVNGGCKCVDK